MGWLNSLIVRWSYRWWSIALTIVAFAISFWSLFVIGDQFAAVTAGYDPFDLQNPLSVEQIYAQLPAYTAASRTIYWVFIAADTVFPLLGGLMLSLLFALALRGLGTPWASRLLAGGGALIPMGSAVLDWVENIVFVAAVALFPRDIALWAMLAVGTKSTKIAFLILSNIGLIGLAGYAVIHRGAARRRAIGSPRVKRARRNA